MSPRFDPHRFISQRSAAIVESGIRRVFELARSLKDPINLSIGQPDFDVPPPVRCAAIQAIESGQNKYTVTQGIAELHERLAEHLAAELPHWKLTSHGGDSGLLVTCGVSGGLMLACLACLNPGDEVLIPDPYFVMYKNLVTLVGARPVYVDTYPDFRLTARRFEPHITPRTKLLIFNSPCNPTGTVATNDDCRDIAQLATRAGILLLSDEIYDEFCYEKAPRPGLPGAAKLYCPTPAAFTDQMLLLRGFSKSYAMTGWRMGYAVGPKPIIDQMTKLQQYSFVCAPSMAQVAAVTALDVDMTDHIAAYRRKRDLVVSKLAGAFDLVAPGGAFYAFPKVPDRLRQTGSEFVQRVLSRNVILVPGKVFSERDTHFRLAYTVDDAKLSQALDVLVELARG